MQITKLQQMLEEAKKRPKKRLVVVYANDLHTIEAVNEAISMDIVEATLTGDETKIKDICKQANIDHTRFEIIHETNDIEAGLKCCDMINKGHGNIIMKGTISTDNYMRCILNKERGIMSGKGVLTHVSVIEANGYGKLLIVGDVAVIPQPDIPQKVAIVKHLINTAHCLGNELPKVGLLAATEKVSFKIPSCSDAALIAKMADRGEFKSALVDGPLALDGLIDKESCDIKGIKSPVAGDADCILFPNIESGNTFYKTCSKLLNSELAANVVGAKVPAILSSRGDSSLTKLYSIALAALTSSN
ncbi:MAG: phosphate acyltransferase [Candidatus Cloacimonadales bacterium]|jgi:phosphate butyryltransferase|nr:phosphate acyltransferase [Candidatus Cloacimonadota bacterium]MDX9976703.1 phosphate acyltransferase [Candidatus Cloacimonadales bacterium]